MLREFKCRDIDRRSWKHADTDTLTLALTLAESGRLPMQIKLIESQARYWERLYSLQDSSCILHLAFTEHLQLMKKQKKCRGSSSVEIICKICEIDGFCPMPSAAAILASAQQRLNIALTEEAHEFFLITVTITHTLYYTNTLIMQGGGHTRAGSGQAGVQPHWTCTTRQHGDASRVFRLGAHGLEVTKAG